MSLVVTLHIREGIVMAADSRITLNATSKDQNGQTIHMAIGMSDNNRKLFVTRNNVGIAAFGQADFQGVPMAGYVDTFIDQITSDQTPAQVAEDIMDYFSAMIPVPNTTFHVAGYNTATPPRQEVWLVDIAGRKIDQLVKQDQQGMAFGGEADVVARLLQPVSIQAPDNTWQSLPQVPVPINFFTIQDAVDFAVYLIRTTIDTIRFQSRPKNVGGPIDVMVIRSGGHEWVNKKRLQMPQY